MSESLEPASVDASTADIAKASYERCCEVPEYFAAFYHNFFEASPGTELRFANTDFELQHKLLRHALQLLFLFSTKSEDEAKHLLRRVAERHSRTDLNIDPTLYPGFVDSLVKTSKEFDPQFTPDVERAWRDTLAPGIAYMINKY
jgi:hemoglobin-like flavoprotein